MGRSHGRTSDGELEKEDAVQLRRWHRPGGSPGHHDDPAGAYRTVRNELRDYGAALDKKNELVALNKCDALKDEMISDAKSTLEKESGKPVATISGIAGTGLDQMLRQLKTEADVWRAQEAAKELEKDATQREEGAP